MLKISLRDACDAIIEGYRASLTKGGAPITLAEEEHFLQTLGFAELKAPEDFWQKLNRLPASRRECSPAARNALEQALPKSLRYKLVSRTAGTGSLRHFSADLPALEFSEHRAFLDLMILHSLEDVVEGFDRVAEVRPLIEHHALRAFPHRGVGNLGP